VSTGTKTAPRFQVELVWNREFHFVPCGKEHDSIDEAILLAREMENSGDGERVKKTRVVNEHGKVVWAYGNLVK